MDLLQNQKEYREERFEYALYINEFVICKRNFRIDNFIEDSMSTMEFKNVVDSIVQMIDDDLKSKSRVYTWYYWDENKELYYVDNTLEEPLIEPWECTFKFVVTDNKREVFTKIWDGRNYPKAIRDKVDLSNKFVRITTKEGKTYSFDKETYFRDNEDRLTQEMYILKAMMYDKPDILAAITKKICEACSYRNSDYQSIKDYTTECVYGNDDIKIKPKSYMLNINKANNKWMYEWGKGIGDRIKKNKNNKK